MASDKSAVPEADGQGSGRPDMPVRPGDGRAENHEKGEEDMFGTGLVEIPDHLQNAVFETDRGFEPARPFQEGEVYTRVMSAVGREASRRVAGMDRIWARVRRLDGEVAILKRLISCPNASVDELVETAIAAIDARDAKGRG